LGLHHYWNVIICIQKKVQGTPWQHVIHYPHPISKIGSIIFWGFFLKLIGNTLTFRIGKIKGGKKKKTPPVVLPAMAQFKQLVLFLNSVLSLQVLALIFNPNPFGGFFLLIYQRIFLFSLCFLLCKVWEDCF